MTGKQTLILAGMTVLAFTFAKRLMAADNSSTLQPVPSIDLNRYAGKWYEIARLPNSFQKSCAGDVSATYTLKEDGKIGVLNECRKADGKMKSAAGVARKADKEGPNSKLEVRFAPAFLSFLPVVWGDYWVIELSPNYEYAVIGEPSRKYLWILSRSPKMDNALYQSLLQKIAAHGYDTSRIVMTRQAE
jgi:apolipoprotein D and lipocalin family protein